MNIENGLPVLEEYHIKRKSEYIAGLRELADWLEAHPHLPAPACSDAARFFAYSKEEFAALRRASGLTEKSVDDDHFMFVAHFPGEWYAAIYVDRDIVCRKVKVGEKIIEAKPERTLPAEPERVMDVYEWRCDPILEEADNATAQAV